MPVTLPRESHPGETHKALGGRARACRGRGDGTDSDGGHGAGPAGGQINLEAETGGLSLDSTVNGPVTLALTPPPGVQVPSSFPATETLVNGQVTFPSSSPPPATGGSRRKGQAAASAG